MKKLQQFTNNPNSLCEDISTQIKRIEKLPLPYTGNKKKLLHKIHQSIVKHGLQFTTVLDAFSGSASVSLLFKLMGKNVIANDILTSSYLNAVAFVENPGFKFTDDEKTFLLYHQNENKNTFVEDNYLGSEFRSNGNACRFNKFTLKECRTLDNFRANIDELCSYYIQSLGIAANSSVIMRLPFGSLDASCDILSHRKRQQKNYGKDSDKHDRRIGIYYDDDLNLKFDKWFNKYVEDFSLNGDVIKHEPKIKRASFLSNIQQHVLRDCMVQGRMHQGQSLAEIGVRVAHQKNQLKGSWDNNNSTEMDFYTRAGTGNTDCRPGQGMKWWTFADIKMPGDCVATNMDIISLLQTGVKVDCCYFDPPYGGSGSSSNYPVIYRFFEEYIYSKKLEELDHIKMFGHRFIKKKTYEQDFIEMLECAKHIPIWMFSFNDSSWKDIDYITGVIKQFKSSVIVDVLSDNYRYLYRRAQGRTSPVREYLIIAK